MPHTFLYIRHRLQKEMELQSTRRETWEPPTSKGSSTSTSNLWPFFNSKPLIWKGSPQQKRLDCRILEKNIYFVFSLQPIIFSPHEAEATSQLAIVYYLIPNQRLRIKLTYKARHRHRCMISAPKPINLYLHQGSKNRFDPNVRSHKHPWLWGQRVSNFDLLDKYQGCDFLLKFEAVKQ